MKRRSQKPEFIAAIKRVGPHFLSSEGAKYNSLWQRHR
ncbi:MAG: hypothetical protein QOH63_2070 [Acidobacteriota bacterium]|jgi:hypothetical protein|nr:hypothetical protein [Acidobacteriota bacterium]